MYRNIFALFLFAFLVIPVAAQVEPYDLTVEYMTAPVGIDEPAPRLSWKSRTTEPGLKNVVQTAYHVLVASSPEILASDKGDLWDSGTVESDQSLNIEYAGKPLETSQRCYWKVKVQYTVDGKKLEKAFDSPVSNWMMGVTKPEDWKAKWIGSDEKFRPDYNIGDARWIWTGDATDLSVAPQGKRYFRMVFPSVKREEINKAASTLPGGASSTISAENWITYTVLAITADDEYKVFVNGKPAHQTWGHFNDWHWMRFVDISEFLHDEDNVIAVEVTNKTKGPTGLLASVVTHCLDRRRGGVAEMISPTNAKLWTSAAETAEGWNSDPNFKNEKWKAAVEVGPVDCEPWGKIVRRFEKFSPAFAKTFNVDKKTKTATLHITGLGFYEALLNGKKIGNKVLDPMQTRYDKRVLYSTYDLTDSLKAGNNRLNVILGHGWYDVRSVAVWNFDNAPWRDFPRMIAQLEIVYDDGSKEMVVSDESWEQTESPIALDCIRQGEASMKSKMRTIGRAVAVDAPKGKLVAEAVPPSIVAQELKPVKISETKPGVYVVDFGQNIAGWIRLKIDGQKPGDFIRVKHAERLDKEGNVDMVPINAHYRHHVPFMPGLKDMFQVDQYRCDTGSGEVFENRFVYHGFQYVEITGLSKAPTAENLVACLIHNDFKTVGKFECSNELFNKIQAATVLSYKGNFVNGVPTDCPHREKNGWTGDAQLASELAQYNFDNTAAYEKWIYDLMDEQRPDGNLPGIVPTSGWGYAWGNGPAWDSALCIIPMMLYEYKGDRRILERAYPAMKKYVDYLTSRAKEDGLVYHGLSDWCFAKTQTDAVVTSSVYYYIDASIVAGTAELLGRNEDAQKYFALAERIRDAYKKKFLQSDGTVANGSQVAQSFGLYYMIFGWADDSKEEDAIFKKLAEAVEKAENHLDVGILGAKSLFHTLTQYGRTDLAMKILNQKTPHGYGDWFERGATTLWEDWKDGSSRNHIMYGDVSTWFYKTLAGIHRGHVAFRDFSIEPEFPNGIDWVKAEHDSPYGPIKVDWRRDGKKIKLNLAVPVNVKAMFGTDWYGSGEYSFEFESP